MTTLAGGESAMVGTPRRTRGSSASSSRTSSHAASPHSHHTSNDAKLDIDASAGSSAAADPEAIPQTVAKADAVLPQNRSQARKEFKRLARMYQRNRAPPPPADMARFAQLRGSYSWLDIIHWQEEVGLRRGVVYDHTDNAVTFQDFWPLEPHEVIISEFNLMFAKQLRVPWDGTQFDPIFEGVGSANYWYPGKNKSPNSSFRPNPRLDPNGVNAALVQIQPFLRKPWPTIVLEIGDSQSIAEIIRIRDVVLGHTTQVNVFLAVVYDRKATHADDTWWACLAHRDVNVNPPLPNAPNTFPPCIVIAELAKINGCYRKVDLPFAPNTNTVWQVDTSLLFHPEPVPALNPPLPPTLDLNMERFRQAIIRTR